MDLDPDTDAGVDKCGHGGFRPGAGRKRKAATASIQIMANERREEVAYRQKMSKYEKADEKEENEDEDEDSNINMDILDNIE